MTLEPPQERWRPAWVRFYGPGSYAGCPWTWAKRIRFVIMRIVIGRGPVHVTLQDDVGWLYVFGPGHKPKMVPAESALEKPIYVVPIEVKGGVDRMAWYGLYDRRFQAWRSVLHALWLLPRRVRVMNCLLATCRLIGEEEIFRTPRELLAHLESDHVRSLRWRKRQGRT